MALLGDGFRHGEGFNPLPPIKEGVMTPERCRGHDLCVSILSLRLRRE